MPDEDWITLSGRVLLPDGGERDCTIRCGEPETMRIAPVFAAEGARLLCHVPGLVEGVAGCSTLSGQDIRVHGTPSHLARLAARIAWHQRRAAGQGDQRGYDRIVSDGNRRDGPERFRRRDARDAFQPLGHGRGPTIAGPSRGRRRTTVVRHLDDGGRHPLRVPLPPQDVTPETVL